MRCMAAFATRHFARCECARVLRTTRERVYERSEAFGARKRHSSGLAAQSTRPLRVGVVGSGPAGFYAAARLIDKVDDVVVDMFEQLPVPFGLVRFGVAPDHPEVKNCEERFEELAKSPKFSFIGNVTIGRDISLKSMRPHYDALILAYGASLDKALGIPGESMNGVYSARDFVGWYNGLPEFADLKPNLDGDHAVVIGNGNVALDVARILLSNVATLKNTDISTDAIERLAKSRVKHVSIVGRRGPMQAAFTIKELRELMNMPSVYFTPPDAELIPSQDWISQLPKLQQRRYRTAKLLREGSRRDENSASKRWSLLSLLSPSSFNGPSVSSLDCLESITFTRNQYVDFESRFSATGRILPTDEKVSLDTNLAFRSIGYASQPLTGLSADLNVPFDERRGVIPNDGAGRVLAHSEKSDARVPGCYCTGWVKSGPTGVIASTMEGAFHTADAIIADWKNGLALLNGSTAFDPKGTGRGWEGIIQEKEVQQNGLPRWVSWEDWLKIDRAERAKGKPKGKPRDKFTSLDEMLQVLD